MLAPTQTECCGYEGKREGMSNFMDEANCIGAVLAQLRGIALTDVTDVLTLRDGTPVLEDAQRLTPGQRAAIASVEKGPGGLKVKFYDKLKALELLVKYHDLLTGGVEDPREQPLLRAIRESTGKVVDSSDIEELQQAPAAGHDLVGSAGAS